MTKQMLKGIRVNSKDELAERIYRYFDEINAEPIVYHWTYKMDEIDPDEAATIKTINNLIYVKYQRYSTLAILELLPLF